MTSPNLTVKTKIFSSNLMSEIASNAVLGTTFNDICKNYHHNSDLWHLKCNSKENKQELQ